MGGKQIFHDPALETLLTLNYQYYFCYCEAGFATKTLGDVIITVGREGAMELMEGIPL
jgi:hypothetical protein